MDFQQVQYTIDMLVQRIRTGKLALPDFQRDFVWNPARVVELLDSISRQWPIGSLLLLNGPQEFAIRSIDHGPAIENDALDLYILDGQQRVTSLFHAVANVSDFCYYIDFNSLLEDGDDYIRWQKRKDFEKSYPDAPTRAQYKLALVQDVWDLSNFYSWLGHLESESLKEKCVRLREKRLPGLHAKVYKIVAIVLDQSIDLEALARIFETLNRTGLALNAFDLMVATLYPSGFKLRDEWDRAREAYPILREFDPDELEIVKLVALVIRSRYGKRSSRGVRQGDLLNLDRQKIREAWPESVKLYAEALRFCRMELGVSCKELVPAWSMILGIAVWIHFNRDDSTAIHAWWNERVLSQFYGQAANTRLLKDFDAIVNGHNFDADRISTASRLSFDLPSKQNGLLMRGIGAALIKAGARDILTGERLADAGAIAFRSLCSDGTIRRIATKDHLNSLVVISDKSDKEIAKSTGARSVGPNFYTAVESQGFDRVTLSRDTQYFATLLQLDVNTEGFQ